MRVKDEIKREAIFRATVKVVNKVGFAASSVAKIAREAGVSPATIYIYYENKEDLLVSTYIEIKRRFSAVVLRDFDESLPIRDILERAWRNTFAFITENPELFYYAEQFANSPFINRVNREEIEKPFEPVLNTLRRGIEQKIIKEVPMDMLLAFIFYPAYMLAKPQLCPGVELTEETIEAAFSMAWDAIKR